MMMVMSIFNARKLDDGNRNFFHGKPALGFQYDSGAMWACVCRYTPHGFVPGKVNNRGEAYYSWGGTDYRCADYTVISGTLIFHTEPLPSDCETRGFDYDDGPKFYNAIITSNDGMVPGRANADLTQAWYPTRHHEHTVHAGFYIIC